VVRGAQLATFRDERRRDPQFAADRERAIGQAIGRIRARRTTSAPEHRHALAHPYDP